jgi:hypothetical protein
MAAVSPQDIVLSPIDRPPSIMDCVQRRSQRCPRSALFADVLIRIKVGLRHRLHKYPMRDDLTSNNEVACPICGRPLTLLIIRRAFAENLYAFECKPCQLSMTEPERTNNLRHHFGW